MKWILYAAYFFFITGALTFLVTLVYWFYSRIRENRARQWNEAFEQRVSSNNSPKIAGDSGKRDA